MTPIEALRQIRHHCDGNNWNGGENVYLSRKWIIKLCNDTLAAHDEQRERHAQEWRERESGERPAAQPAAQPPCIGGDPLCPCQDGDQCHYRDTKKTKGWPIPEAQPELSERARAEYEQECKEAAKWYRERAAADWNKMSEREQLLSDVRGLCNLARKLFINAPENSDSFYLKKLLAHCKDMYGA